MSRRLADSFLKVWISVLDNEEREREICISLDTHTHTHTHEHQSWIPVFAFILRKTGGPSPLPTFTPSSLLNKERNCERCVTVMTNYMTW